MDDGPPQGSVTPADPRGYVAPPTSDGRPTWPARLEDRRRRLHMSRRVLAQRSGISLSTTSRILAGRDPNPRLLNLQKLAAALGVVLRLGDWIWIDELLDVNSFRLTEARIKARKLVGLVQGTISMHGPAVGEEAVGRMIDETAEELFVGSDHRLWGR